MNYIVPNPNASCPACGTRMGTAVLLCTACWLMLPNKLKAELRYMVMNSVNIKSKMAKCVRVVREKRGLFVAKLPENQIQGQVADILPAADVTQP